MTVKNIEFFDDTAEQINASFACRHAGVQGYFE